MSSTGFTGFLPVGIIIGAALCLTTEINSENMKDNLYKPDRSLLAQTTVLRTSRMPSLMHDKPAYSSNKAPIYWHHVHGASKSNSVPSAKNIRTKISDSGPRSQVAIFQGPEEKDTKDYRNFPIDKDHILLNFANSLRLPRSANIEMGHQRGKVQCKHTGVMDDLIQVIMKVVRTIKLHRLFVVFENEADRCLLARLATEDITAEVWLPNLWLVEVSTLTYLHHTQHILIGQVEWIATIMTQVKDLYTSSRLNAMNTRWIWVSSEILDPSRSFEDAAEKITESLVEGVRGVLLFGEEEEKALQIRTWVKIASIKASGDGSWFLSLSGVWDTGSFRTFRPLWNRPSLNFQNRTVRIACIQKPVVFEFQDDGGLDIAHGYIIDLLLVIRDRLNFRDSLVPTRGFGLLQANGSYNGMVGVLQRKEADMAALDFTPSWARTKVVDFSTPIGEDIVVIISSAPSLIIKPFLLLQIFSPMAWTGILVAAVVTGMVVGILTRTEDLISDKLKTQSLHHYLGNILKSFVYQSCSGWPTRESGRLASSGGILFALIMGSLYSGSITAFMAIPFRSRPINSVTDLVESKTRPALRSRTLVYQTLTAEGGSFYGVRDQVGVFTGSQTTSWDFFKTVADGTFALVDVYSSAVGRANRYERRGARCQFYLGRVPVKTDLDVFAFMKNSPILWSFDDTIKWLRYFGLINYIKDKYFLVPCEAEIISDGPQPLSITQAQGAAYVLLVGLVLSLNIFIAEIIWARIVC